MLLDFNASLQPLLLSYDKLRIGHCEMCKKYCLGCESPFLHQTLQSQTFIKWQGQAKSFTCGRVTSEMFLVLVQTIDAKKSSYSWNMTFPSHTTVTEYVISYLDGAIFLLIYVCSPFYSLNCYPTYDLLVRCFLIVWITFFSAVS